MWQHGSLSPLSLILLKTLVSCPLLSERRARNPYTNKGKDFNRPSLTQGFPPAPWKPSGKCYWVCKEYFSEKSMVSLQYKHYHFQCRHTAHFCVQAALCPGGAAHLKSLNPKEDSIMFVASISKHAQLQSCTTWQAVLRNLYDSAALHKSSGGIVLFGSPCWEIQRRFSDTLFVILKQHSETLKKKKKIYS